MKPVYLYFPKELKKTVAEHFGFDARTARKVNLRKGKSKTRLFFDVGDQPDYLLLGFFRLAIKNGWKIKVIK